MSIKRMFLMIYVSIGLLLVVLAALALAILRNQNELARSEEIRFKSYLAADELRQSSDDLTRMARTYVVSGDEKYEKMYNEILDIRNGKKPRPQNYERIYWDFVPVDGQKPRPDDIAKPLQTIMRELGFTEEEFDRLKQAQANSDGLVHTEVIAMNAIKGIVDENAKKLMQPGESNAEFARRIMHDGTYHKYKSETKNEIGKLMDAVSKMSESIRQQAYAVERIADGDMTVDIRVRSEKDLLGGKLAELLETNHRVFGEIRSASEQIEVASGQVGQASQPADLRGIPAP